MLVLGGIIAAINSCKHHCTDMKRAKSCCGDDYIRLELNQLNAYFSYCKTVVRSLTESSTGTAELVSGGKPFYDLIRRQRLISVPAQTNS